jgi:hypothetical protein
MAPPEGKKPQKILEPLRSTFLQLFEAVIVELAEAIGVRTASITYLGNLEDFYRTNSSQAPLSFEDLGWPEVSMEYNSENIG